MKLVDMASDVTRPDDERVTLYEANNKLIRLEGEAKVLRILLGKCVDVIDTIPGESDDECRRLLRLKDACIDVMKVVL